MPWHDITFKGTFYSIFMRSPSQAASAGSDSMLPVKTTVWGKIMRGLQKMLQISLYHPQTLDYFRSYSAVVAERQRDLLEEGSLVIHPLSLLSIIWKSFMILVNLAHMTFFPFRLFFVLQPLEEVSLHVYDTRFLPIHILCLLDVIMNFNIGYTEIHYSAIVLDRKSIARRYLLSSFFWDLLTSTPFAYTMLYMEVYSPRLILAAHCIPLLRAAKICSVSASLKTFIKLFSRSYIVQGVIITAVVVVLTAHWCACLMYLPPVLTYYWTGAIPPDYNYYLNKTRNLLNHSIRSRYTKAIVIVVSAFFGTGFSMFHSVLPDELLIHSLIIVYAKTCMVFTLVFSVKAYLTTYDSTTRYYALMNQVEEYMKYRQFPVALKKRMRAFYEYRYQKNYFKGQADLDSLSEELRDEVRLHTSRSLIHKVKLFEDIPASVVGTVLGCLRSEVFLANDLVVAAGEFGDCMYFIATGTVAVYSLKGVEVCHLEDGAHFGEVALLMKDSKRAATVVAVENTQMYRLDADDFKRYILTYPMLYERIETLASRRMNEIVLVDDTFRHEKERNLSIHSSQQDVTPLPHMPT
ncbi:potassium/sodium hyperpolarization-activated cyclic nucleotide-gated channel 3-like [Anticarsia gemmatalis]|uniref:potassium/sodium hyperpolarization-activated cyclic nucleotide-gated channel 3-like n=1 Tax=Anticarsia gemmatalis TaxID=129554 RepID=UPI003F76B79F